MVPEAALPLYRLHDHTFHSTQVQLTPSTALDAMLSRRPAGPSVFDLPVSGRPGGVRGSGREGKTKNKKQRGPSPRMLTDLVQEWCNGRNGRNGRPTRPPDGCIGHPLTSVGIPRLNPPGGLMVAEAILDLNFQRKCSSWPSRSQTFACGACNGM